MKLVCFTNAAANHKGNLIYINPETVSAVYEVAREAGGSLITIIYGGPTGVTWEVEESFKSVINALMQKG